MSVDYIVSEYDVSIDECTRMLLRLDRMGLIELHAQNRVRLKVAKNVFWQKDGPLWKLYYQKILNDFMDHGFESPEDRLLFSPGVLSSASMKIIIKQIDHLFKQYNELAEMDAALPLKGRRVAWNLFQGFYSNSNPIPGMNSGPHHHTTFWLHLPLIYRGTRHYSKKKMLS